jgi:hypothetical protein
MKLKRILLYVTLCVTSFSENNLTTAQASQTDHLKIGWASGDITPSRPVLIAGQFYARVSEGVKDPITVTALAIESINHRKSSKAMMITCDLVSIPDGMRDDSNLRDRVRALLQDLSPALQPEDILINATHTHAAPYVNTSEVEKLYGISLDMMAPGRNVMPPAEYLEFAAAKIAGAARQAWTSRKKGGVSYGLSKAVIGHNRLQSLESGKSVMYGQTNSPEFSHIEGYENHDLNLLYTWDEKSQLTGVVVNAAIPAQVSEHFYELSADFWTDTRQLLKEKLGKNLYVLAQVSTAGDQSPHVMWGSKAEERMQKLMQIDAEGLGRGSIGQRKYIAHQISNGVEAILPYMKKNIVWNPVFKHKKELISLSRRLLQPTDLENAKMDIVKWGKIYHDLLAETKANPAKTQTPRWYTKITESHSHYRRGQSVLERYELEKVQPKLAVEVHVLRIDDMALASNPFELYLDYGIQMITRSAATQTFLVQLAGAGTYLPTKRSIAGGAYGAVPASTIMGPEGGKELVEATLKLINSMW